MGMSCNPGGDRLIASFIDWKECRQVIVQPLGTISSLVFYLEWIDEYTWFVHQIKFKVADEKIVKFVSIYSTDKNPRLMAGLLGGENKYNVMGRRGALSCTSDS